MQTLCRQFDVFAGRRSGLNPITKSRYISSMGLSASSERMLRRCTLLWCCLIFCAARLASQGGGVPGAASGPLAPACQGSIEGTVINEVTREPVRAAQIVVGSETGVPAAVTDANGHFTFRNLPPGTYFLQAQHPEFPLVTTGLAASHPLVVNLIPDEQQRGLVIPLTPGGSISGRILNEDGQPVSGCYTQALQYATGQSGTALHDAHNAASDGRGEYRIRGLARGHYYVAVQCGDAMALTRTAARSTASSATQHEPGVEAPKQKYALEFYPETTDLAAAARLMVEAGAVVSGIDFRLRPTSTVTVRGRLTGDPDALSRNPHVRLEPRDAALNSLLHYPAAVDKGTGLFHIDNVPAGAYALVATASDAGHTWQAKDLVDIGLGSPAPAPIELPLIPGSVFNGAVEMEGGQPASENMRIVLTPLDAENLGPSPDAKVDRDGSFSIVGMLPGRWRLELGTASGYLKSLSVGGQEVSASAFTVAPGAGGEMRIVLGTKMAQVEGSVDGIRPEEAGAAWLVLAPEDVDTISAGRLRNASVDRAGRFHMSGLAPGRYRLFALASAAAWTALRQNPRVLQAIAVRGKSVDLEAGGRATVEVNVMPVEELAQALQDVE